MLAHTTWHVMCLARPHTRLRLPPPHRSWLWRFLPSTSAILMLTCRCLPASRVIVVAGALSLQQHPQPCDTLHRCSLNAPTAVCLGPCGAATFTMYQTPTPAPAAPVAPSATSIKTWTGWPTSPLWLIPAQAAARCCRAKGLVRPGGGSWSTHSGNTARLDDGNVDVPHTAGHTV